MSVLSSKEREALDDVFLSIHVNKSKYSILKKVIINLLKSAKHGLKETKAFIFLNNLIKKKKNLSK
jgi:hypothetical protein